MVKAKTLKGVDRIHGEARRKSSERNHGSERNRVTRMIMAAVRQACQVIAELVPSAKYVVILEVGEVSGAMANVAKAQFMGMTRRYLARSRTARASDE